MKVKEKYINHLIAVLSFEYGDCEELLGVYLNQMKDAFLEVDKLIEAGDCETLASKFHQLKGTSGNLQFTEIASWMIDAETAAKAGDLEEVSELMNQTRRHEIFSI